MTRGNHRAGEGDHTAGAGDHSSGQGDHTRGQGDHSGGIVQPVNPPAPFDPIQLNPSDVPPAHR